MKKKFPDWIMCLAALLAVAIVFAGCEKSDLSPDTIVVSPSPVHIMVTDDGDQKPDITVTVYLKDEYGASRNVYLDAIATAKFGTQTLTARQSMTYTGRTRGGLLVYQWVIPGYLLESVDMARSGEDRINLYVRVENESGVQKKLETETGISRTTGEIQAVDGLETTLVSSLDQLTWQYVGTSPADVNATRFLLCPRLPAEAYWSGKGCEMYELSSEELVQGKFTPDHSTADGHYWWTIQQTDGTGTILYQFPAREILVDSGQNDWVGIEFSDEVLSHTAWNGEEILSWHIYRDGVLVDERPAAENDSWNVSSLLQLPGYYEIMITESQNQQTDQRSNTIRFAVRDQGQVVTLQEEFGFTDAEVEQLDAIMDGLMMIPADQVEFFISRMAFQGVVDADGLRALLNELGYSNRDLELMAERGQVDELTHIFAQAYARGVFQLSPLAAGLDNYLGSPSE